MRRVALLAMLVTASVSQGQEGVPGLPEVAHLMRPYLVEAIPPVLHEKSWNWNKTTMVAHAIHWKGLRPEIRKTPRNDGHWQKIRLSPRNLATSLDFRMSNPKQLGDDKQSFQVYLSFLTTIEHEQQIWESGVRLYSDSTRARARVMLWLNVENTIRLDTKKNTFLPDVVIRLKATDAKLAYNDLVVEHIGGVGGTAAKLIGEAMEGLLHEARPNLERQLLDKAGAAIVRSADTREIRLGLGAFLK